MSYDLQKTNTLMHFNNSTYDDPRKFILAILKNLEATTVESHCASTIVFTYSNNKNWICQH